MLSFVFVTQRNAPHAVNQCGCGISPYLCFALHVIMREEAGIAAIYIGGIKAIAAVYFRKLCRSDIIAVGTVEIRNTVCATSTDWGYFRPHGVYRNKIVYGRCVSLGKLLALTG